MRPCFSTAELGPHICRTYMSDLQSLRQGGIPLLVLQGFSTAPLEGEWNTSLSSIGNAVQGSNPQPRWRGGGSIPSNKAFSTSLCQGDFFSSPLRGAFTFADGLASLVDKNLRFPKMPCYKGIMSCIYGPWGGFIHPAAGVSSFDGRSAQIFSPPGHPKNEGGTPR